jgi:hypothetical protein
MSLIKKHIADSWARGLLINEIVEQVYILKKLRGNTCVDHGYRERLGGYVGSEIEGLKRKPSRRPPSPLADTTATVSNANVLLRSMTALR